MAYSLSGKPAKIRNGLKPKPLRDVATFRYGHLKNGNELTEDMLLKRLYVTPNDVLRLKKFTKNYLCTPEDDPFQIEFEKLHLYDNTKNKVLFEIKKRTRIPNFDNDGNEIDDEDYCDCFEEALGYGVDDEENKRFTRYELTPEFLFAKVFTSTVQLKVGGTEPLTRLRVIERLYFQDNLLATFNFKCGMINASSRATLHFKYILPTLSYETRYEMVMHPFETRSDTFYFVEDHLIKHHKADYSFTGVECNLLT